jgi:hypothetical protein
MKMCYDRISGTLTIGPCVFIRSIALFILDIRAGTTYRIICTILYYITAFID